MSRKSNWYRQTEALLYNHKSLKIRIMALVQRIDMVKEQLIPSMIPAYELRESANYSVSSPVEKAAIERLEGNTIQKLERKIKNLETMKKIVEISIDTMLDPEQKQLVNLIYNQKYSAGRLVRALVEEVLTDIIPQVGVEAWIMCVRLKKSYITTGI